MFICPRCSNQVEGDSQFCRHCGERISLLVRAEPPVPPYHEPYGYWHVTTEGDCEGRTTKDLGYHKGYLDAIARDLSGNAFYRLQFTVEHPDKINIQRKPRNNVHISLDIASKTWDLDSKTRVEAIAKLLKDRPVKVTESNYFASVLLTFEEENE